MGFSPREVGQMTLWEFECAYAGWSKANGPEQKAPSMSDDRMAELGIVGFE